jgi:hypothetical protein
VAVATACRSVSRQRSSNLPGTAPGPKTRTLAVTRPVSRRPAIRPRTATSRTQRTSSRCHRTSGRSAVNAPPQVVKVPPRSPPRGFRPWTASASSRRPRSRRRPGNQPVPDAYVASGRIGPVERDSHVPDRGSVRPPGDVVARSSGTRARAGRPCCRRWRHSGRTSTLRGVRCGTGPASRPPGASGCPARDDPPATPPRLRTPAARIVRSRGRRGDHQAGGTGRAGPAVTPPGPAGRCGWRRSRP